MKSSLPAFDNPPVVEVALSVQFEKLDSLGVPQLGYVWRAYRDRFPKTEEQPALEPAFEQFGPKPGGRHGVRMELLSGPPRPRVWFLNDDGSELVQIQQDRFVRNWRKRDDEDQYPRYSSLRESFKKDLEVFCRLVEEEGWGSVQANQCEVTYVNVMPAGEGWQEYCELDKVLTVFSRGCLDDQLQEPEEASLSMQYLLKEDDQPVGRLYIGANPVRRVSDNRAAFRLTLTARGRSEGSEIEGVMRFLDRGHEAVVRGFASITTAQMHEIWKRVS